MRFMKKQNALPWMAAGVAAGLLLAFTTRWYWGLAAAVLMYALIALSHLVRAQRPG